MTDLSPFEPDYPRDLIGYGAEPPHADWPNGAHVAVQFVINYEEGAENAILHGDAASESFLSEMIGTPPIPGMRHMSMESLYEYGSRAGFWRLHRIFTEREVPVTVYGVTMAMRRNPAAVEAMLKAGWEVASHGYRWINYQNHSIEAEREDMEAAIYWHEKLTGQRPLGWYTGRTSPQTHQLVVENGGFLYDADSYADDLPYWCDSTGKPQLIVPYTLDTNDMRFAAMQGFNSGDQFFTYLKDAFDVLYQEGKTAPKMLSIGLHCRLIGRPARAASLMRFIDYVRSHDKAWICKREEIARHWVDRHPYNPKKS
ncbi:allantoinase PuuE [Pokkaliibacter sp. CJK22405]|uniref:allantoinase PuuE n=1 Tax=Pokkaliibacter sp. CJK22405 TaxID=3384615 RepID=UPI0039855BFC